LLLLSLSATPVAAQGLHLIPGVEEVPSDTVDDVAIAKVDLPHPIIYYNPAKAERYGPLLTRFFLAHEYGHIALRHTRAGFVGLTTEARDSILVIQELEADCYAAALAGDDAANASEAAYRFFNRTGPFRFDRQHPTGAQRANRIASCIPDRKPVTY